MNRNVRLLICYIVILQSVLDTAQHEVDFDGPYDNHYRIIMQNIISVLFSSFLYILSQRELYDMRRGTTRTLHQQRCYQRLLPEAQSKMQKMGRQMLDLLRVREASGCELRQILRRIAGLLQAQRLSSNYNELSQKLSKIWLLSERN